MSEVVVGVDGSEGSREALRWAVDEARLRGDALVVATALHVPALLHGGHVGDAPSPWDEAAAVLDEAVRSCGDAGVRVEGVLLSEGPAARALLDRAAGASTLVVGTRGRSRRRAPVLGSVSQQVVVHAAGPVVVVPAPDTAHERDDKVVVGIDGSAGAQVALQRAAEEARLRDMELEVVTVSRPVPVAGDGASLDDAVDAYLWTGVGSASDREQDRSHEAERRYLELSEHWHNRAEQLLGDAVERLAPAVRPARVRMSVLAGRHAGPILVDLGGWARLVVVGSRGRGGVAGLLLGSVSRHCARHATVPVMVVPQPEG